jgi:HK97 family phage major capsid protein/HK97 family phage prohead protease
MTTATHLSAERIGQINQDKRSVRGLVVERAAIDETARTATLAFASEQPYERWWGIEILDCTPSAMDTSRLRSGANLLCDHDTRDVVGVIESVEIGPDRVGRAVVRFGKSVRAEEVWQDVRDGIRRNVSVGYMINEALLESTKDGVETYRVTSWTPYEVSLVSVPADASVGVGRSAAPEQRGAKVKVEVEIEVGDDLEETDPEAEDPPATGTSLMPTTDAERTKVTQTITPVIKSKGPKMEKDSTIEVVDQRNHAADITKIAASIPGGAELAMKSIQAGHTVEDFQKEAIRHLSSLPVPTNDIGMSGKETKQYSVLRALNALTNPTDQAAQRAAAFERECSDEYAKKSGKAAQGLFVPPEVQRRDLNVGTPTAGGNTVATNLLAGSFIELLRNAMVIDKMGAIYLPGLVGNIAIPKQTGSATAYWVIEGAAPTESQQTIGQVGMSPKTIGAYTDFTRRMFLQSSIEVEQFVMNDLAKTVGLGIQQDVFTGPNTTGRLNGLLNQITPSVVGGTNGLAPTWDHIVDLETAVSVANADIGTLGYLTNAKVRGKLKKSFVNGVGGTERVWQNGSEPLNGYRTAVTNAMPSNLTKGTGTNLSAIAYGNFADLVIGLWSGLDLMVDPYAGSTAGTVRVIALQDVDMALRNTESFATMVDAITA